MILLGTLGSLGLDGCSSLDRLVFGTDPDPTARPVEVAPLDTSEPYPPVSSVPARPQLSYNVQQERAIVDALISDREHARYTGSAIRYRSGVSGQQPRPPAGVGRLRGEDVVSGRDIAAEPAPVPLGLEDSAPFVGARALPPERAELDDGGLDDFVRGLVDETAARPDLGTETAVIDRRDRESTIPGRKGDESAFERLFLWIAEELGGDGSADSEEQPRQREAPPKPPAEAVDPEGGALPESNLPKLKPDESADPPEPAPAKPDEAEQAGAVAVPLAGPV